MLAALVEQVAATNRLLHVVHFRPPHPEPLRMPRPTDTPPRKATSEDLKAKFGAVRYVPPTQGS